MCSPVLATQPVADVGGPGVGGQTPKKARTSLNEFINLGQDAKVKALCL